MADRTYTQYGRKWEIILSSDKMGTVTISNDSLSKAGLQVSFDIQYPGLKAWYLADFFLYNLKDSLVSQIMISSMEGVNVKFSAGYIDGNYGLIFKGKIFQSYFMRRDVNDYIFQLHCIAGSAIIADNFLSCVITKDYTVETMVNMAAAKATNPITVGNISKQIDKTVKSGRGLVIFGHPTRAIDDNVVKPNNAILYGGNDILTISKITDTMDPNPITLSANTGIIGTPRQTDYGISLRTLLNPKIVMKKPAQGIIVKNTVIELSTINPGQRTSLLPMADGSISGTKFKAGYYQVIGVHHIGTTRGNDWFTDIEALTISGKAPLQLLAQTPTDTEAATGATTTYFAPDNATDATDPNLNKGTGTGG
jgi:hypothetical protein